MRKEPAAPHGMDRAPRDGRVTSPHAALCGELSEVTPAPGEPWSARAAAALTESCGASPACVFTPSIRAPEDASGAWRSAPDGTGGDVAAARTVLSARLDGSKIYKLAPGHVANRCSRWITRTGGSGCATADHRTPVTARRCSGSLSGIDTRNPARLLSA
ncbi:hypothetical protein GCM10010177_16090 [Actinomadura citrea]|nr:hypothetical protein GCM10010177_16090 [Actinomadura citrea]